MKKLLLSLGCVLLFFTLNAQVSVLFESNFDELLEGSYLAKSYPIFWETWGEAPGTNEDALISTEQSSSNPQSAKCAPGTDVIFVAGDKTSGIYTLDFDMYIPNNASAHFNLLHIFDRGNYGSNSEWAMGFYFNITASNMPPGTNINQNGTLTPFSFPFNKWFPVSFYINLDDDIANVSIDGTQILEWQFSLTEGGGSGKLQFAGADFFPPQANSKFYIDNFKYVCISGDETFPILAATPTEITVTIAPDATANQPITITNTGTSIGGYNSWMKYDFEPVSGNDVFSLSHCGELDESAVGFTQYVGQFEIVAKFTASQLCGEVGSYITKLSYFVPDYVGDLLTFRIYGPLADNQPGKLLAEVQQNAVFIVAWNEITLPEPLLIDQNELWITVEMKQLAEAAPIAVDDRLEVSGANWLKIGNGNWAEFTGFGNFLIKGTATGSAVPACWITTSGATSGSVPKDNSKSFNVNFNSNGLEEGTYNATIFVETNDTDNSLFTIPVTLVVNNNLPSNNAEINCVTANGIVAPLNFLGTYFQITNFDTNKKEIEVLVTPQHPAATVSGDIGVQSIKNGSNNYYFTITAEDRITTKTYRLNIIAKLGIAEIENIVKLFPNPVLDYLYLDIPSDITINQVFVSDFTGKMVKQFEQPGNFLNLSDLSAGQYLLKVTSSKGDTTHKFIKK